jgi:predicted O-methyltransferase YrrM
MNASAMKMDVWTKLFRGSEFNKSRLHDRRGSRISTRSLLLNGPRALVTGIARLAFDSRPVQPWISYDAHRFFKKALSKDHRVLEFGSGMSTLWYADRVKQVVAVEDFAPWYEKVAELIRGNGADNIQYVFAGSKDEYCDPSKLRGSSGFDMVMIDGSHRDTCVDTAIEVLNPGGMIYLDNADRSHTDPVDGDAGEARRKLLAYAEKVGAKVIWFTDFAPTQFYVASGLLVVTPAA